MHPPLIQAIHDGCVAYLIFATGYALAELWAWALRADTTPGPANSPTPEPFGYVCRTLGITQVDDSE
jgi:hypothetical protein